MPIKIAIVEDHELFREGICSLLSKESDFKLVGQFSNGKELIDSIKTVSPDIILLDIEMPVMNGIETTEYITYHYPDIKIIILSMYSDFSYYDKLTNAGAKGFVLKNAGKDELENAIRDISKGKTYFSQELLEKVINTLSKKDKIETYVLELSPKETELISLICKGFSNKIISEKLFVSPKTVESNKTKLFEKLQVKNSIELVTYVIKNNIIEL